MKGLMTRGTLVLPLAALAAIVIGLLFSLLHNPEYAHRVWMYALVAGAVPLLWRTAQRALQGDFATDAIASLAMITAFALGQPLPGVIVVVMQSGGEWLERLAERRATRALRSLEEGAPRIAHLRRDGEYVDVPVRDVRVGDRLLVKPGEIVPVDGCVEDGRSHMNTAQITGEPVPVLAGPDTDVFSGYWNLEGAVVMRTRAIALESQYERIVQLVRTAEASNAKIQRLADRYAVWFTPLTLLLAAAAFLVTGDAQRTLAVLVVATPCPLIIATPIALIAGINSNARMKVIVRSGAVLERLTTIRTVVFDKTGTLTTGTPTVTRFETLNGTGADTLLSQAASIEQGSGHTLARAIVNHARSRQVSYRLAEAVVETAGSGVAGTANGDRVVVGSRDFVTGQLLPASGGIPRYAGDAQRAFIGVNGRLAGYVEFDDLPRADLAELMRELRARGMERLVMLSGDDNATVQGLAASLGIDEAYGELDPPAKLEHIRRLEREIGPALMLGDGTNDAPALAAATVGVAVTPRGGGIAAETADVILMGDDLLRLLAAMDLAGRTLRIARQSIVAGLGLSAVGMLIAAAGYLPPVAGAVFQEVIDVGVILNALRAAVPQQHHIT
jgi:heavy metal translocating P-type ATPase